MSRDDRPRVLYSFPHPYGSQGIGSIARAQVEGLRALGVDVTVWCTSVAAGVPTEGCHTTMVALGRRIPLRVVGTTRAWRHHDRRVAGVLARDPGRFSLVHAWPLAAEATFRAARQAGVATFREVPNTHTAHAFEVVAAEHTRLGLDLPPGYSHRPDPVRLAREEAEYALADCLLVPASQVADTFLARGFAPSHLGRHQYGYDPQRFGVAEPAPHPRFEALFVGTCDARKGLHHALDAWQRSGAGANGRLRICGRFAPGYRELLGDRLLQPGVEVLGPRRDIADIMRQSDVLVLPSIEEGSALVTYEAMASGCTLAVSDATGAHARHEVEALVHPAGDVDTLTSHLDRLRRYDALLARLRAAAVERSRSLTWADAAARLLDCYSEVSGRAAHRVDHPA